MKPLYLRFRGLHSYRAPQEIDFALLASSGLFGIFGPTGAGKSTVPDAITLALYGNVERAARGTQGVINLAEKSCEVAFTFALGGQTYLAQRLFERVKNEPFNCKSDKCRLVNETTNEILADRTTEMTQAVERLLGMDMERFCQTVLLPQGKFDRFLRLTPAHRGNLLEDIFHLQEYGDSLRNRAKRLGDQLDQSLELAQKELDLLGDGAPERLAAARQELALCRERLQEAAVRQQQAERAWQAAQAQAAQEREREELARRLTQLQTQADAWQARAAQLEQARRAAAIRPLLERVASRYEEQQQADRRRAERQRQAKQAAQALQQAEQQSEARRQALAQRAGQAEQQARQAQQELQALQAQAGELKQAWRAADAALAAAQRDDAAAFLAGHLTAGAPCPVCGSLEHPAPSPPAQSDLAALTAAKERAFALWQKAEQAQQQLQRKLSQAQEEQVKLAAALLETNQEMALQEARQAAQSAATEQQLAEQQWQHLEQELASLRAQALAEAAAQGFESVNAARKALLTPAQYATEEEQLQQYRNDLHTTESRLAQLNEALADYDDGRLPALEREAMAAKQAWQRLLVAEGNQVKALETLEQHGLRWRELQTGLRRERAARETARQLEQLLKGKAFIRYLARERLRELAAEASHTIGGLSNQRYQLQLFEGGGGSDFIIVDQLNGGQRRPVATLSGGEIFLVSLSLALALSRKIEMQGAPLGFFFLDEGFGTLDEGMLEAVMSILERLPSDQRAVGLISHVAEVKARLPRYLEVRPATDGAGSELKLCLN